MDSCGTWKLVSTLSEIFESNLVDVLSGNILRSFITQVTLGKLLAYQVVAAIVVFVLSRLLRKTGGAFWLLVVALRRITCSNLSESLQFTRQHGLAIGSVVIHVLALSFWLGAISAFRSCLQVKKS